MAARPLHGGQEPLEHLRRPFVHEAEVHRPLCLLTSMRNMEPGVVLGLQESEIRGADRVRRVVPPDPTTPRPRAEALRVRDVSARGACAHLNAAPLLGTDEAR